MICTKAEKSRKNCPFADHSSCMGNECMAWRWYDPLIDPLTRMPAPETRRGYCGLAGKPEYEE
jgi:hypothetical protein